MRNGRYAYCFVLLSEAECTRAAVSLVRIALTCQLVSVLLAAPASLSARKPSLPPLILSLRPSSSTLARTSSRDSRQRTTAPPPSPAFRAMAFVSDAALPHKRPNSLVWAPFCLSFLRSSQKRLWGGAPVPRKARSSASSSARYIFCCSSFSLSSTSSTTDTPDSSMSQAQKHADTERDAETVVHHGDSLCRSSLSSLLSTTCN